MLFIPGIAIFDTASDLVQSHSCELVELFRVCSFRFFCRDLCPIAKSDGQISPNRSRPRPTALPLCAHKPLDSVRSDHETELFADSSGDRVLDLIIWLFSPVGELDVQPSMGQNSLAHSHTHSRRFFGLLAQGARTRSRRARSSHTSHGITLFTPRELAVNTKTHTPEHGKGGPLVAPQRQRRERRRGLHKGLALRQQLVELLGGLGPSQPFQNVVPERVGACVVPPTPTPTPTVAAVYKEGGCLRGGASL